MKVTVTKRHINAARLSDGKRTPIELSIMEMDCFEEVSLLPKGTNGYSLSLDGLNVSLPKIVQKSLRKYIEKLEMDPISFELPVDNGLMMSKDDLLFEPYEDSFDYGYGY
ncbi:MAG: hypothetical protein SF052_14935 [Bacteroidia bacterium]|nr:hypothetical protein [Bacteroidia bacterium]